MSRPVLSLDFDGVMHSYVSYWRGADVIPDPPVPGLFEFLFEASTQFKIMVFSSRSNLDGGLQAMKTWLMHHAVRWANAQGRVLTEAELAMLADVGWPLTKPPALVSIDDRAVQFTGTWPDVVGLLLFTPWNYEAQKAARRK